MSEITINKSTVRIDLKGNQKDQDTPKPFNYIVEIQKLVAQILNSLGRVSANDHESIEKMKNKFMNASLKSAHLQTDLGKVNRNIGIASFAVMCVRICMPNADDQAIMNILANQTEHLAGMYTSGYQSEMQKTNAESQLELEKYRTRTAAKQSDGNAKQDYLSLLQAIGNLMTSSSRPGG